MANCLGKIDRASVPEEVIEKLCNLFLAKGYPDEALKRHLSFNLSYKGLTLSLEIPLAVVVENKAYLIVHYKPSLGGLLSFEREALALARVFSNPPPIFALLTNLKTFVLINVNNGRTKTGEQEIIPDYEALISFDPMEKFSYNLELEKRLLSLFLSGG